MSKLINDIFALKDEYYQLKDMIDLSGPDSLEIEFQPLYYPELLRIKKDLSCLSLDLAKESSRHMRKFKKLRASREVQRYLKQKELIDSGTGVTMAESLAKEYAYKNLEEEAVEEGFYMTGKAILNQVNEILKSVGQDIAIIRKEYESINNLE